MKSIGATLDDAAARAEAKRERHREWLWCRRPNRFSDDPLWRVVAERLRMPIYQVTAFANRLEELANMSTPRGYVGDFSPAVFGAALGMSGDDAARIFAELEHPDIRWIEQEHVSTFYERNKDDVKRSDTEALRSRRSYARRTLRKALKQLLEAALIDKDDAEAVAVDLDHMPDEELFALDGRRKAGQLAGFLLSTSHTFSHRENVRSHPRAEHTTSKSTDVDNTGAGASRESAGSPKGDGGAAVPDQQDDAEAWLAREGVRVVVEHMALLRGQAETRVQRWKRELEGDAYGLALVIDAAAQAAKTPALFHVAITDGISRRLRDATDQRRLPLVQRITGNAG